MWNDYKYDCSIIRYFAWFDFSLEKIMQSSDYWI